MVTPPAVLAAIDAVSSYMGCPWCGPVTLTPGAYTDAPPDINHPRADCPIALSPGSPEAEALAGYADDELYRYIIEDYFDELPRHRWAAV